MAPVQWSVRVIKRTIDVVSASVGLAIFPDDGSIAAEVVRAADEAQLAAKRGRKQRLRQVA